MSKKKKVEAPVYEEMQDTPYITGLREDLPMYREGFNRYLENLDVISPEVQQRFKDISSDFTGAEWNDFNRNALANYKSMNQANRNRFGSMGASGAMYNADTYGRQLNDLASRIAAQTAAQEQNLMNNYYDQKLNTLNAYDNAYGNAGNITYGHDKQNWNIRNMNKEAKYVADVQNANRGGWNWGNSLVGGLTGLATGGVVGGVAGLVGGGLSDSGQGAANIGGTLGQNFNTVGWNTANSTAAPTWLSNKTGNTILFGGQRR